jgi:hypothetical protein
VLDNTVLNAGREGTNGQTAVTLPPYAAGNVRLALVDERHLEVCFYDVPAICRRWNLPLEYGHELVLWWEQQGSTQKPRGGLLPEQRFGRIFVSLLSHGQVFCRGSDALGRSNITGYQFPRPVVEAIALYIGQNQ